MINGTMQAAKNTQDGIGLIHTAEGAMQEIQAMVQCSYKLSIAASNGTYNEQERQSMQEEIDQLLTEIDRIATCTEFNGIPVLQGEKVPGMTGSEIDSLTVLPSWVTNPDGSLANGYLSGSHTTQEKYKDGNMYSIKHGAAVLDFRSINSGSNINDLAGTGFNTTCFTCNRFYSIKFVNDGSGGGMVEDGKT